MDQLFDVSTVLVGVIFLFVVFTIAKAFRQTRAGTAAQRKQDALFQASFPELQPHFHPRNVLLFVAAWRARVGHARASEWSKPAGLGVDRARIGGATEKGHPVELLDAAGVVLARFLLLETPDGGGVLRVGSGKLTVNVRDSAVRYWHPQREFKWSRAKGWRVLNTMTDRGIESSDSGLSLSRDSSSSSSGAGAAAAAAGAVAVAGAGGAFDGGGSSSSWDGGDSRTAY
jgi:hypothetical protein